MQISSVCLDSAMAALLQDRGPYQSGGGVPPELHGAHGEREKSRNLWSPRENYFTIYL